MPSLAKAYPYEPIMSEQSGVPACATRFLVLPRLGGPGNAELDLARVALQTHDICPSSVCNVLVVCKGVCFSLRALDLAEDLVGVLGPGKRLGVVVPVVDEGADGLGELAD